MDTLNTLAVDADFESGCHIPGIISVNSFASNAEHVVMTTIPL